MSADAAQTEARFAFGDNWAQFLRHLGQDRIDAARRSLADWLGRDDLSGLTVLDIGSGSGLFKAKSTAFSRSCFTAAWISSFFPAVRICRCFIKSRLRLLRFFRE